MVSFKQKITWNFCVLYKGAVIGCNRSLDVNLVCVLSFAVAMCKALEMGLWKQKGRVENSREPELGVYNAVSMVVTGVAVSLLKGLERNCDRNWHTQMRYQSYGSVIRTGFHG